MIKGIHHVSMRCREAGKFAEMKHFYRDVLGLEIVREWEKGFMAEAGNCWLEIMLGGNVSDQTGIIRHFAFFTDQPDELIETVRKAGYEIIEEPHDICIPSDPEIPARIAFCRGPLGEEIEFFFDRSENGKRF